MARVFAEKYASSTLVVCGIKKENEQEICGLGCAREEGINLYE
jgi:hypothetical protein